MSDRLVAVREKWPDLKIIEGLEYLYLSQRWHPVGFGLCEDPYQAGFCFAGDFDGGVEVQVAEQIYELVRQLKPEAAAEAGMSDSYSSCFIARALEDNGCGHLWACEIDPLRSTRTPRPWPKPLWTDLKLDQRITAAMGNSADPSTWARANPPLPDKIQFAFIDSLHEKDHVLAEWRVLGPRLSSGGCTLFHDVLLFPGVAEAVNEIAASIPGVVRKELRSARGASILKIP